MIDVVYLAWNRLEFTKLTFDMLLANTDWSRVDKLVVYDDGSEDGTVEHLYEAIHKAPVEYHLVELPNLGPVGAMNHYVENNQSDLFAKVDNDIVVPPGWLERMSEVMEGARARGYAGGSYPLDALGMEAGRMGTKDPECGWEHARWIGGVGLIRTSSLGRRPQMKADGRFGWTEFQVEYGLHCGWVCPDLMISSLDQVPFEPFVSLNTDYHHVGWGRDREWPKYHEVWMRQYWDWWLEVEADVG